MAETPYKQLLQVEFLTAQGLPNNLLQVLNGLKKGHLAQGRGRDILTSLCTSALDKEMLKRTAGVSGGAIMFHSYFRGGSKHTQKEDKGRGAASFRQQ
ncbi:hypothetical protein FKM82_006700 [Ascaphus truei]